VINAVYYALTDRPNLHHIFPTDFVSGSSLNDKFRADSLMNIAYLPQLTNLKISNKNPLHYLKPYLGETPEERKAFIEVLNTHLIPTEIVEWQATLSELPPNALIDFIESRLGLFIAALRKKLIGIEINEYDSAPPAAIAVKT
jgi:hypothetical protein